MPKAICRASFALFLFAVLLCSPEITRAQIAPGVTQSAAHIASITGIVTANDGTPVAGADVKLSGPAVLSTKSDAHGTFAFTSVTWGTYQIVVTSALGMASRTNVAVNGDINVAIQYQAQAQASLRTIAHVSTSSAGAHINVTSSAITSISPGEYAFQGNGTWKNLFAQIPGVAVSGAVSGGGSPFLSIPGSPQAPVVLTLNGALPYETSTTLDGMPLQGISVSVPGAGCGVDLSTLPLNAFDAADIVRGPGANAPSIVDSIGGSFVLHAPGQVDANHFEFSASNDPYGGIVSNAKIAVHLGRLSATFIYGVNDSPGPLGTTRLISADGSVSPGDTIDGQPVQGYSLSVPNPSKGIENCNCTITNTLLLCCVPASTAWTAHSGAASLSYKVTPSITAEVFYAGGTSNQNAEYGYYPVEFAPAAAVPGYSGNLSPSPSGQTTYSFLGASAPDLYTQSSSLLEEKLTAFIGRGVLRLAALQHNSFEVVDYYNGFSSGMYTLWGTANVGSSTPGTPTAYNGTPENVTFSQACTAAGHYWSNNRDLLGSYAVQVGSASSVGISYTTSYYNDPFSESFFFGTSPPFFSFGQASALSETTNEIRLHADTEVGTKLSLGLSWYFARGTYHVLNPNDPSGNTYVDTVFPYSAPRFGAVWQASHDIAIRASAGGGYALPQLGNLTGGPIIDVGPYYDQFISNPNLKPEETFGFDVGTDVRFHQNTVLSFDLYQTNLYGQFFTSTTTSKYNGLPLYLTQFGNIANSRMEGINLDIHHDVPSGWYWHGTLGLTRGYVVSVPAGFYNNPSIPCTNCTNQAIIPGPNFAGSYEGFLATVPYASASVQLGYKWHPDRYVDLVSTYYGNNNIYYLPAFVEFDAHLGYALTRNVSLLATFRNITGIYDQSIQTYTPAYAVPLIPGGPTPYYGANFQIPYGPRAVTLTVDVK